MPSFSELSTKKRLRFLGTRFLLCVIALLVYFIIWRPARVAITEHAVYPQVKYFETEDAHYSSRLNSGSLLVQYEYGEEVKKLSYRPEFGFFFLVALIALLFVTKRKRPYLVLVGLHLLASVLVYLCLILGAVGFQTGFILTDLLSGYLTPALSLALVPLVVNGLLDD